MTNGNGKLPSGWEWTTFDIVCEKVQDGTHFSPKRQYSEPASGRYLYLTSKNVRSNGLDLSDATYVDEKTHRHIYERCDPKPGDVLLTKDGVNTGNTAVNRLEEQFSLLSSVALLRPREGLVDSYFLKYYLDSPFCFSAITGQMTGTAIKRIILRNIKSLTISIAPLPEQHRIVAKIEELLTHLDVGMVKLKRMQAALKRYRAAVLKAACEGRLVPQDPNDEPAEKLLERILAERRAKWEADLRAKGKDLKKTKYVEPEPPDTDALPELPEGWCWAAVEQLAHVGTGATPLRSRAIYYSGGTIPWVTSGALNELFVDHAEESITELALKDTNAKIFPAGTLLVAMYGEGKTRGKISELRIGAATNQAIAALVFNGLASEYKAYVKLFFEKNYEDIRRLSSGGVQPNLNLSIIKHTSLPLPPLAEQHRIVAEVERRLSVMQEMEQTVAVNLARAERLRQAILRRAFEGKLVLQDPNDEPVSVLLKRIRESDSHSSVHDVHHQTGITRSGNNGKAYRKACG